MNTLPQLFSSTTHKYNIYFKHKVHIEHTNQRIINQNYIDTSYKNNNTKNNFTPNTKNLLKHPNTHIKKPILHTNISRTQHIQHQIEHIDELTKPHILKIKLVRPYLSKYIRNKSNTLLGSRSIKKHRTNPLATRKHKFMKTNKNISNPISPYIYVKRKILTIIPIQKQVPYQEATIRHTQLKKIIPYQKMFGHIKLLKHFPQLKSNSSHKHSLCSNCLHKQITISSGYTCRIILTGQGKSVAKNLTDDLDLVIMEADSPPQGLKRNSETRNSSADKKGKVISTEKKGKSTTKERPPKTHPYWLGFEAMEKLAIEEGHILEPTPSPHNVKKGRSDKEVAELLTAVFSYPHTTQTFFPLVRPDGIDGQHFNITQIPFEIETDPDTRLSYDYQVAIYFQKPTKQYTHEEILALTQARLREMRIALGDKIAEPIAILCKNGLARHWLGTIKLHLKHPGVDGINLLNGTRPFILTLDNTMTVGKTCKSYNTVAKNNMFFVKINSLSLMNISGHNLFKEVVEESFKRDQEL